MLKAHFAISEIADGAHVEAVEGNRTRFIFDACPEVYDILTGWGAETENDEEGDPPEADPDEEDDERSSPRTLPPIGSEPDDGARAPLFPPLPTSALPAAVSSLLPECLAACAA